MKDVVDLLGRILLSFIFIYEAIDSILYFNKTKQMMTAYGITFQQDILLIGAILVLLVGGTLLLIGYRIGFGALLLMLYWIPVTFIVHSFWNDPLPERRLQSILFMKNIAILGGLMFMAVNTSGKYSIKTLLANTRVPKRFR
ncbi:MAG: DoxX family protein [Saprospiraceae bacterium]|nr:DoxX family protein [Saprospiraceae bacterium]